MFVVQKHAARRLHYDFRLELDGVLLSWAVPHGPSLDPSEKRLAVRTEDHPVEYGSFEGVIPEGNYGAGTVMLWDRGEWTPLIDPRTGLGDGQMKILLAGAKLRGAFALIRMKGRGNEDGKNWLLIKERDALVRKEDEYSVLDQQPFSVVSNRTMREIAEAKDAVWTPGVGPTSGGPVSDRSFPGPVAREDRSETGATGGRRPPIPAEREVDSSGVPKARRAAQPGKLTPARPSPADAVPSGDEWLHEIKLEGRRLLCFLTRDRVRLIGGDGEECTGRLPELAADAARLPAKQAILDGVLTVMNARGASDARALDEAVQSGRAADVVYFAFDLPFCQGFDLRGSPLIERKRLLHELLEVAGEQPSRLRFGEHIQGNGPAVFSEGCRLALSGIISKKAAGAYPRKRGRSWRVVECPPPDAPPPDADSTKVAGARGPGIVSASGAQPAAEVVVEPVFEMCGVRVTNPDRILYPEERVTKRVLAGFYEQIAEWILPHIVQRPLSLYRCPRGHEKDCFYQKHLEGASIKHVREAPVREDEGKPPYVAIDDLRGLIALAQLAVLEIHPWGSREDNIEKPDRVVFDLDPGPDVSWRQVAEGARAVRELLAELGLGSFVKTTGGKGLHVVVPIVRRGGWDEVKAFAEAVAREMARRDPSSYVATMSKWARPKRIYVDYLRNVRGATAVAAYSTRARPGAAVSTPLHWDELGPHPIVYTVHTLPRRLRSLRHDPWEGFFELRQSITKAMRERLKRKR
jgi:bifunctional non-homologous end joining protein LigD